MEVKIIEFVIVFLLGLAGGFGIGKATQPITIVNRSESVSQANSYAISGTINVINPRGITGTAILKVKGLTNVSSLTVTNGKTNVISNTIILEK